MWFHQKYPLQNQHLYKTSSYNVTNPHTNYTSDNFDNFIYTADISRSNFIYKL